MTPLAVLLIVLVVLAAGGGFWGHPRYGYVSWSPVLAILMVILVLYLLGVVSLER